MSKTVNLLSDKALLKFSDFEKIAKTKKVFAFGTLLLTLAYFFLFWYGNQFAARTNELDRQIEAVGAVIDSRKKDLAKFILLKERIKTVKEILEKKDNLGTFFWQTITTLPASAEIVSAELKNEEIILEISLQGDQETSDLIDSFPAEKIKALGADDISIESITRQDDQSYIIKMLILLKDNNADK